MQDRESLSINSTDTPVSHSKQLELDGYEDIEVIRKLDNTMVQRNYLQIKQDVQDISQSEMERLLNDHVLSHLMARIG